MFCTSAGLYTSGVSAAGEETQNGRPGTKRPGYHHGYGTEGTTGPVHTAEQAALTGFRVYY